MKAAIRRHADAVVLIVIVMALYGVTLFWQAHSTDAAQQAQRRQGELIERKLCTTLDQLAANKPPGGSPGSNPARAYEQRNQAILAQLGPDIGCR